MMTIKKEKRNFAKRWVALAGLAALLMGCSPTGETEASIEQEGVQVVTTFYPVYEFAKEVAGEEGQVEMLLDAGQDTHGFEPSPQDLARIAEADVFVYATAYMETWVPDVLKSLEGTDVKVVEAGASIELHEAEAAHEEGEHEEEHEDDGHDHAVDPHIWLDPVYAQNMVAAISTALEATDPDRAETYKQNTEQYIQELVQLDREYQEAFAQASNRTFVVQHAAFGYLARRYHLEEVAISSLSQSQEVSPAKIAEIGSFMASQDIGVIYYQDSGTSQVAETLAAETEAELAILYAIESIPQEEREQGTDYLALMRKNLEALKMVIH